MVIKLDRTPGKILVKENGSKLGNFQAVLIDGCDTTVPGRGQTKVHGAEAMWEDDRGRLHISDDKRAGPSGARGGLDLGL
jgi:hypothetical protein